MKVAVLSAVLCCLALPLVAADTNTTTPLSLCEVVKGFASEFNYLFQVQTGSAAFDLRASEAIVFVLRPFSVDSPAPQAQIRADFVISGVASHATSGADGVLQITQTLGSTDTLLISVLNKDPLHSTPFILYSFHANHPICAVGVPNQWILSGPLIRQVGATDPFIPATMYVQALPPPGGLSNYRVNILNGGSAMTVKYALTTNPVSAQWEPLPSNGLEGSAQPLYLSITPLVAPPPTSSGIFSLNVVWSTPASASSSPTNGANGANPTPNGNVPSNGDNGVPPTPLAPSRGSSFVSTLLSFIKLIMILAIVYLFARAAYNFYHGERRFPNFIPHHEQIGGTISSAVGAAKGLINRGRPGAAKRHAQYEDISRPDVEERGYQ